MNGLNMIFENVGTKKLYMVINVCFIDTSKQPRDKKNAFYFCLMSRLFCPHKILL